MEYDLLIKNGRVIDGSGMPSFRGDVAVRNGRIVELGKLSGSAKRVIDAEGKAIAPGFIDNHCHYDAQVTWDPLCTFSCYHGATSVIIGNCSLSVAPVKRHDHDKLLGMLSQVEAIPMDVLQAGVPWNWETFPQYMDALEKKLGVNVGTLMGHTAIRLYAMGEASQERPATEAELDEMRRVVREGLEAGALGLSLSRNMSHFDVYGKLIPASFAPEPELFALAQVLKEVGTGVIQSGGGTTPELKDRLMSRLSEASGRRVIYNTIAENARAPMRWKKHLDLVEEMCRQGYRALPLASPNSVVSRFTMKNCQVFRQLPTWLKIMNSPDEEKIRAYGDLELRKKLREEVELPLGPDSRWAKRWDLLIIEGPALARNERLKNRSIAEVASEQGKDPLDVFLDLVVEEELNTLFALGQNNTDPAAMTEFLSSPYTVVGLSDGGAHVQFHCQVSYSTRLLGYWVRERGIMPLEHAVRRLTFDSAVAFGIYDRGLLQPGMAADLVVFDPETVKPRPSEVVHDLPNNGWRVRALADGIDYTVVNGEVLIDHGEPTGATPGKILRNALYNVTRNGGR
ncbi:MAG TPA: D-aminoacylase [Candidatus Acidoferrales bacterium]|nr:D-aminoacylase [Candidatus Acidoferrales bacterium]